MPSPWPSWIVSRYANSLPVRFLKHSLILDSLWDSNVPNQQKLLALWFFLSKIIRVLITYRFTNVQLSDIFFIFHFGTYISTNSSFNSTTNTLISWITLRPAYTRQNHQWKYFFISKRLKDRVKKCNVLSNIYSDHSAVADSVLFNEVNSLRDLAPGRLLNV